MVETVAVSLGDYPQLSQFLARFPDLGGGEQFWLSRFGMWWDDNPAFAADIERGWALKDSGRIVGFLGNIPSFFQLDSKPVAAFSVTTWMVLPSYRDLSLELLLTQMRLAKDSLLFDTTPTRGVAQILENLGFTLVPWGEARESLLLVDFEKCLRARLGAFGGAGILAKRLRP